MVELENNETTIKDIKNHFHTATVHNNFFLSLFDSNVFSIVLRDKKYH